MLNRGHLLIADIFVWNSRALSKTLISSPLDSGQKKRTAVNNEHQELIPQGYFYRKLPLN